MLQELAGLGFELVSTGGSAAAIEAAGVDVRRVEDLTGFPEMLDGAPSRAQRGDSFPSASVWLSFASSVFQQAS